MKNILPSILTLAATAASIFSPQIQHAVAAAATAHPAVFTTIGGFLALVLHYLPSPAQTPNQPEQ